MRAPKVYIARHGERIDHVDKQWKKVTADNPDDPFLTERGLKQAEQLGAYLANAQITKIFVSPFYRTLQTAAKCAEAIGVPMYIEPGMCEALLPNWYAAQPTLKTPTEAQALFPTTRIITDYQPVHVSVYPETKVTCAERVAKTVREIATREDGNVLFVGHGITCENAAKAVLGVGDVEWIDYCALIECVKNNSADSYSYGIVKGPHVTFIEEKFRPCGSQYAPPK